MRSPGLISSRTRCSPPRRRSSSGPAARAAGCRKIFADKKSGKNAQRPELKACHAFLSAGDTLVVPELARYGRSLHDLISMVGDLRKREIGFTSLHEQLDTTTPGGRLVFHVFAALAEFIRELIVDGTHEGLAAARARGRTGGRPTVVTPELLKAARDLLPDPERSVTSIAKLLGISVGTLYNHIPDLQQLRAGDVGELQAPREGLMIAWLGPADFPEHRHAALLHRLAWVGETEDPDVLVALIAERAARPCRVPTRPMPDEAPVAVLGDDSRYHLLLGTHYVCGQSWRGRKKPPAPAIAHEQWCKWWSADGYGYRTNAAPGTPADAGVHGEKTVRWTVLPTHTETDPALVRRRERCPVEQDSARWPPFQGPVLGPIIRALIAALACHVCHSTSGVFVDHDPRYAPGPRASVPALQHLDGDLPPHLRLRLGRLPQQPTHRPPQLAYPKAAISRRTRTR